MSGILQWFTDCFTDEAILSAIKVTFQMAVCSCLISSLLGIGLGLALERFQFPGKHLVIRLNRTLMGMPPVVAGLIVYMLLMRRGPLGWLGWLFTIKGMVVAQALIITPIMTGMVHQYACTKAPAIREFCRTMGASRRQTAMTILWEMRHDIYFCIVTAFGRSISEVDSVMLVGETRSVEVLSFVTFTLQAAFLPLWVLTVMVAVPRALAVMRPLASTVATLL